MGDTIRSMRWCASSCWRSRACSSDPTLAVVGHTPATACGRDDRGHGLRVGDAGVHRHRVRQLDAAQLAALVAADETLDAAARRGALDGISRTEQQGHRRARLRYERRRWSPPAAPRRTRSRRTTRSTITTVVAADGRRSHPPTDPAIARRRDHADRSERRACSTAAPVSWTVYGPAGTHAARIRRTSRRSSDGVWEPTQPTCTDATASRHDPRRAADASVGGYAVQMRVAWATEQPPPYTSLAATAFGHCTALPVHASTGATGSARSASRHDAAPRLPRRRERRARLAITIDARARRSATAWARDQRCRRSPARRPSSPSVAEPVPARDRDVYVGRPIAACLVPLFNAPTVTRSERPSCPACVDDAIVVPPCGTTPRQDRAHTARRAGSAEIDAARRQSRDYARRPPASPVGAARQRGLRDHSSQAAGAPTLRPARVDPRGQRSSRSTSRRPRRASRAAGSAACTLVDRPLVRGAGVGFTGGTEPRMVVAIGRRDRRRAAPGRDRSLERPRARIARRSSAAGSPAASLPEHIVVGQFDTDSRHRSVLGHRDAQLGHGVRGRVRAQGRQRRLEALSAAAGRRRRRPRHRRSRRRWPRRRGRR